MRVVKVDICWKGYFVKTKIQLARTLIAANEAGSIAGGARALNMTRSAASKNITALEQALGVSLLKRSTRKVALTEAGEIYVRGMRSALSEVEALESEVSAFRMAPSGTLTIESSVLFGRFYLTPIIHDYLQEYPSMAVDLRLSDGRADVASGEVDIYFRTGQIRHQDMIAVKLMDICFRTVASPAYLEGRRSPEAIDDLENHNCLNFRFSSDHSVFQWHFKIGNEFLQRRFAGNLISTDAEEILKLVLSGAGIAQLPNQLVDPYLENGTLVELFRDTTFVSNSLRMCLQRSRRNDAKLRSFQTFLKARLDKAIDEKAGLKMSGP